LLQKEQNPEAFFGKNNVYYGSGYTSAIQRIFEGNAEAAAVSDYVFLEDKHLTAEEKSKLRILQKQGPVPTHIIAIRKTISDNQKKLLKKALLDLNQENPELRDQVFTSKLVESTSEKHLSSLKEFTDLTGFLKNKN
ncbi:MAG: PhnD/SsuA/transferrin family substrate-binding protein, partial [Bdellovibrionia bacterium]